MSRSKKRRNRSMASRQTSGVEGGGGDGASLPTAILPTGNGQSPQPQESQPAEAPPTSLKEEVYLDERKLLVDLEQKSADQHDKAMLTLTAGGLALSITFLEKIAPNPLPETLWLIASSWGGFITSLFAILGSFQTSQWACCRQRDILDQKLLGTPGQECGERNRWAKWTHRLNLASYGLFLLAVIFLACFSWLNVPAGKSKNVVDSAKSTFENQEDRQKTGIGIVPPKTPDTSASPMSGNKPKASDKNKQEENQCPTTPSAFPRTFKKASSRPRPLPVKRIGAWCHRSHRLRPRTNRPPPAGIRGTSLRLAILEGNEAS